MKVLIVGSGITGTLLAWKLYLRGIDFQIWTDEKISPASFIAAGLINPITGKRLAKISNFEDYLKIAIETYQEIENYFQIPLIHPHVIYRFLEDETLIHYEAKNELPEFQKYMEWKPEISFPFLHKIGSGIKIHSAYRINLFLLFSAVHNEWIREGKLIFQSFDENKNYDTFDKIILCRGFKESESLLFPFLEWENAAGEILIFYSENLMLKEIVQINKLTIIPMGYDFYWLGATYLRDFKNLSFQSNELENFLKKELKVDYQIYKKQTGIRPILKERFPKFLQSNKDPRICLINGMGSKGTLLAPKFLTNVLNDTNNFRAV